MCGVVGYLSFCARTSPERILASTRALTHRGPDGQRIWISEDRSKSLGHARLSIIDLATGDQPLTDLESEVHLVANGELYDYENIRDRLIEKGHVFKTKSDSEIALHLYKEMGADFVTQLRGEFAILLWDERNKRFIAVRDRFGIKPLFYTERNGEYYFASEAKALFEMGVPAEWDEESLYHNSYLPGSMPTRSLFKNIHPLPAGCMMIISQSGMKIERYWDFNYPEEAEFEKQRRTDQEYIDEFRDLFSEAVKLRLKADVPVATYLSGGLDSSAVTGVAQLNLTQPVKAFTLAFDDEIYDESPFAIETCKKLGADLSIIPVHAEDIVDNFSEAVWHAETLAFNGHVSAKFILSDHVRKAGYKVVLTGEGSDEILAGYAHFRQDMILHTLKDEPDSIAEKMLFEFAQSNVTAAGSLLTPERRKATGIGKVLGFTPAWIEDYLLTGERNKEFLSKETIDRFKDQDVYCELANYLDVDTKLKGRHPVNQSAYLWIKSLLQNYLLSLLGDRLEMAHSVEGRLPFLDHKVVEFAMKLPIDLKIRDMTEKFILRESTKHCITDTIYKRKKHPFLAAPTKSKNNKKLYDFIQSHLKSDTLKDIPLYDYKSVQKALDNIEKLSYGEQTRYDPNLLILTSICVMHAKLQEQRSMQSFASKAV